MTAEDFVKTYIINVENNKIPGVYFIYCVSNKKIYIGSSKNIFKRWKSHFNKLKLNSHNNLHLQAAWNKYGELSFQFNIIEITNNLIERESYYLSLLEKEFCFNQMSVKNGYAMTEELREKLRMARRGKKLTEEQRKARSLLFTGENNPFYGKKHTEETIKKLREINIKISQTEEAKKRIKEAIALARLANLGKKRSEETKEKIRLSKLGKKRPLEVIEKIKETKRKNPQIVSEETKEKIRQACLKNGNKPPNHLGKKRSEETKRKMSIAQKKRFGVL